ncbi:MAG: Uncharacterized protein FD138_752 [Planctomycetota bacterium]|nr:MAG: Uncharacterized protein FD138_752 [Planctomycetota bacterium]
MVLGIVALVAIWIPLVGLMVAPLGALGLLLGVVGSFIACRRKGSGIGYSIAGVAISALALLIGFSVNYVLFSAAKEFVNEFKDLQNAENAHKPQEARGRREEPQVNPANGGNQDKESLTNGVNNQALVLAPQLKGRWQSSVTRDVYSIDTHLGRGIAFPKKWQRRFDFGKRWAVLGGFTLNCLFSR